MRSLPGNEDRQAGRNLVDPPALDTWTYFPATAICLWENLPQVLLGALFFSLACTPSFILIVLGMPWLALCAGLALAAPAWASLLQYEGFFAQGRVRSARLLLTGFRRFWSDSIRLAAIGSALFAVALWLLSADNAGGGAVALYIRGALIVLGFLVLVIVVLYAFPLLSLYEASLYSALHNSVLLSARFIANTLGLVAMAVLLGFAVVYVSFALLLILPAIFGLFVVNNCFLVVTSEANRP